MNLPDDLAEQEKKDLILTTRGYFDSHTFGWHRTHTLDRNCSDQRLMQIWFGNPNSRIRKRSVVETFNYWIGKGKSRKEAYRMACQTQVDSIAKCQRINIDSRTTWILSGTPNSTP
jgi:hypothetical protein